MADTDFNKMLAFASQGELSASYSEIRKLLVERAKDIYGDDIDTSLDCADGIQLSNDALLIQNILSTIGTIYENMSPTQASGKILDVWASYNNVKRKAATKSKAYITIKNNSNEDKHINQYVNNKVEQFALMDQNKNVWYVKATYIDITIPANKSINCWAEYSEYGPYSAPKGWINTTVEKISWANITQNQAAIVGSNEESDDDLRSRRLSESGSAGRSNLQSIKSSLMQLDGIADVKIINNNNDYSIGQHSDTTGGEYVGGDKEIKDVEPFDATISAHKVMIFIKPNRGDSINRNDVAETIWNKMTPGVATQNETLLETMDLTNFAKTFYSQSYYVSRSISDYKSTSYSEDDFKADPESFDYPDQCDLTGVIKGMRMTDSIQNQFVFWKELKPLHPALNITFRGINSFNVGQLPENDGEGGNLKYTIGRFDDNIDISSTTYVIAENIIDYINNELSIFDNIDTDAIRQVIINSDPYNNGKRTVVPQLIADCTSDSTQCWNLSTYKTNDGKDSKPLNNMSSVPITQNLGSYYYYNYWTAILTKKTGSNEFSVSLTISYDASKE